MARIYDSHTLSVLKIASKNPGITSKKLYADSGRKLDYKSFYNMLYRLVSQGLLAREDTSEGMSVAISEDGKKLLARFHPERDGIWKLVIFDIPEKQKYVRVVLRAKLKALRFQKWQNSIWISPYKLDEEIEGELNALAKKFFVRLIKTKDINHTEDLEKMFKE